MKIAGVIPTHNRSDVLPIALDSMSRQKRLPDEVIVVSDVIDEEAEKLTNDFLKSNSMKGQFALNLSGSSAGSSRNAGAALTNADAIAFLDDDDCWHDDYLKEIETAFTDGVDAVVTHMLQFRDGKIAPFHAVAPGLSASDALVVNPGVCGSNIVIRRDVFEKLGGYDETLSNSNDKDFFFRFLDEGFKYSVVARPLSYVNRQDSISRLTNVTPRMLGAFERYWEKWGDRMTKKQQKQFDVMWQRRKFVYASSRSEKLRHLVSMIFKAGFGVLRKEEARDWKMAPDDSPDAVKSPGNPNHSL